MHDRPIFGFKAKAISLLDFYAYVARMRLGAARNNGMDSSSPAGSRRTAHDCRCVRPVNEEEPEMDMIRVGIDLAKNVFQMHGVDRSEKAIWRRKLTRVEWLDVLQRTVPLHAVIGMEACGSAHHWARRLQAIGYTVKLIAPQFVKPYVKSNKNDANDAEAICEAMSRPGMRFVAVKTVEQQDVQAVHRVRAGLMEQRNAKANQIGGLTSEYGIVAPREILQLRRAVPVWLEDVNSGLSDRFRRLLTGLWEDLRSLDDRIRELDREIAAIAASDPVARRLQQLRGVGPMVATALIATVGNARQFSNGRQMAASLGLTPRQNSSGGKERLLGISKRGDAYVRCLLIHGARAMIQMARRRTDALSLWVMRIAGSRHPNIAAVALANKTARIAWAMITRETDYQPELAAH
jgi:transposase